MKKVNHTHNEPVTEDEDDQNYHHDEPVSPEFIERIDKRLAELRTEFEAGQKMMNEVNQTVLRISGAIQVLEEMKRASQ